ncbi:MAG: hypothetical protein CMO80_10885 [Verrucomicrobiales bacterium]|nr:hypothetical protein [Verrucomicrobiales bacterium]
MHKGENPWLNAIILGFLCSATITVQAATVGPVAHWRFDEGVQQRTAVDSIGGAPGTLVGSSAFTAGGVSGNSLSLIAVGNAAVDFGQIFPFTNANFSISLWVKTSAGETQQNMTILSRNRPNSADGYALQVSSDAQGITPGTVAFHVGGAGVISSGVTPISVTPITDGNWHHVVVTHQNGGSKKIYVDGLPLEDTKPVEPFIDLSNPLVVGARHDGTGYTEFFNGEIDDLQLYDRALQETEIAHLFSNPGQISVSPQLTSLSGTVRDAVTGLVLPNVLVSVLGETGLSDLSGNYQISNLNPRPSVVQASRMGYASISNQISLSTQPINNLSFAMSPTIDNDNSMRTVLTWGQLPFDLDSHLLTPVISNFTHHIAFYNRGSLTTTPFANLDVDDASSFGPETITITNLFPGAYHYYVHNLSGFPSLTNSSAEVRIFTSAGEVLSRGVPTAPDGAYWYVARVDGASKTLTIVDQMTTTEPQTNAAPYFTFVSGGQTVFEGVNVTLTAMAEGAPTITYNWFRDGVSIPNQNGSNLVITNVQLEDAGIYFATASNTEGSGRTLPVSLNVVTPQPIITLQPQSQIAPEGGTTSFTVAAVGEAPLLYQWRKAGLNIPGATSPILTLTNIAAADETAYTVVVFNSHGFALSETAFLAVNTGPRFITHPVGLTVNAGDAFSLNVQNFGLQPFFYQWQLNGVPIPGASDPTYRVDVSHFTNQGTYSVVVTNAIGTSVSSNALVSVNSAPVILRQPLGHQISAGGSAALDVHVAGSAPVQVQWTRDGTNLPGQTNMNLVFPSAQLFDNGFYGVWASNNFGSVTSSLARLHVLGANSYVPWTSGLGGLGADEARSVAIAPDGSIYVVGHFNLVGHFETNSLTSAGLEDAFLAKLNTSGQIQWIRQIGGTGSDFANDVAVDTNGNPVIVGSFSGTISGAINLTNHNPSSFTDIYVAKFDTNGTTLWARHEGAVFANDLGRSVSVTAAGDVYICGSSFQTTFGTTVITNTGRILLVKYGSDGTRIWARKLGDNPGHANDVAHAVATDNLGNVVIAGVFQSTSIGLANVITNQGGIDGFVAKYNTSGTLMWNQSLGGPGNEAALNLALDASGNIFVGGEFNSILSAGALQLTRSANSVQDGFVARLDANGNAVWLQAIGGGSVASVRGVTIGPAGNVFLTGYFAGDATIGVATFSSIKNTLDLFVLELQPDGQVRNFQQAGGESSGGDIGNAIALSAVGDQTVAGSFTGEVVVGSHSAQSAGGTDVFISRYAGIPSTPLSLSFTLNPPNVIFSWPVEHSGYIVQEKINALIGVPWQDRNVPLVITNGRYYMTNSLSTNLQFFRLRRP